MLLEALVAALALASPQSAVAVDAGQSVGKHMAGVEEVKVAELAAHPDMYVGKTVRVAGVVVGVGRADDTWMDIAGAPDGPKIRIKLEDKSTDFPIQANGTQVIAEGVFTKIEKAPEPKDAKAGVEPVPELAPLDPGVIERAESSKPAKSPKTGKSPGPSDEYQIVVTGAGVQKR